MNKPYLHSIIVISSVQNGFNYPLDLTGFHFKSQIVEGSQEI